MKTNSDFCAVICEYNPFHSGHRYQLEKIKELTKQQPVCIMSGQFVQRSFPAISDKYLRAQTAVLNGAAAVIELPSAYAVAPAQIFARGAIKVIKKLKNIGTLAMGCETDNFQLLIKIAGFLNEENSEFQNRLKQNLSKGITYALAYSQTVCEFALAFNSSPDEVYQILTKPNNLLCIEYLKAINKENLPIKPLLIKREGDYNSLDLKGNFASATAIRKKLENSEFCDVQQFLDEKSMEILKTALACHFVNKNLFEKLVLLKLRSCPLQYLRSLVDCREGLENRIKKYVYECTNLNELIDKVKTKRYIRAGIERLCTQALLGITKDVIQSEDFIPRLLCVNKTCINSFSEIALDNKALNSIYTNQPKVRKMLDIDILATDIYKIITHDKGNYYNNKLEVLGDL